MLEGARHFCLRLYRDDSGVVLALTLVLFLTLFVMACSVYVVGETVRQKIELQNAADAAAYSGALVQADAISRVAAMNRAMAWTYAQMVRMEMDYIVDAWLWMSVPEYMKRLKDIVKYAVDNTSLLCLTKLKKIPQTLYIGDKTKCLDIYLNGRKYYVIKKGSCTDNQPEVLRDGLIGAIKKPMPKSNFVGLGLRIMLCRTNMKMLNRMEKSIIRRFPRKIEKTVKHVLKANVADLANDRKTPARGGDIRYALLPRKQDHKKYFETETDERTFLRYADIVVGDGSDYFQKGSEPNPRGWFLPVRGVTDGIQRGYTNSDHGYGGNARERLSACWKWFTSYWKFKWKSLSCKQQGKKGEYVECVYGDEPIHPRLGRKGLGGKRAYKNYETETVKPQRLTKSFFGRNGGDGCGTIVVGVARRMNNPLQFMVPRKKPRQRGIFNVFTLDNDKRFMWAAASARAGYRFPDHFYEAFRTNAPAESLPAQVRNPRGGYQTTFWNGSPSGSVPVWNIRWSDWDAVMLPLCRAWTWGEDGNWQRVDSSGKVLSKLADMRWKGLYRRRDGGKLGFASHSGPTGMGQGKLNYSAANHDLVFH